MSLSHAGYAFENCNHGIVTPVEALAVRMVEGNFFGVKGTAYILGQTGGQVLACEATLSGYSTCSALFTALSTLYSKRGQLTGTLAMTVPTSNTTNFPNATFVECQIVKPPWMGGIGSTWVSFVRLIWKQTGLS